MKPRIRSEVLFWGVCVGAVGVWIAVFLIVKLRVNEILHALGPQEIPSFPYDLFLGGNPSEVLSHYCGFFSCSGVFAVLMAVGWAERRLLGLGAGCFPLRTVSIFLGFAPMAWMISVMTFDWEGVSLDAIAVFYAPLVMATFWGCRRLLSRMGSWLWDGLWTFFATVVFIACQLLYEPSGTGGPNGLVTVFLLMAAMFCSYPWLPDRKEIRTVTDPLVEEKG